MITGVLVDSREPASIQKLTFGGVPVATTALDAGDLWVTCADGEMLIVERKTPDDLLGSIKDERVFQQVAAMRSRSPWAYVVVTGSLVADRDGHVLTGHRATGWQWGAVQGALVTLQELGACVVYARNEADYEDAVIRLARRERCADKVLKPRQNSRVMSPAEQMLSSLPGIGSERAQALLDEFDGHAAQALAWLTWRNNTVNTHIAGVGAGTKLGVRRALGLRDSEEIDVYTPEAYRNEAA